MLALACLLFDPCCLYFNFICYVILYLGSDNDHDYDIDNDYDTGNDNTNNDDDNALRQGTRVEGDRKGKGTWYPGVISCDRSVSQ